MDPIERRGRYPRLGNGSLPPFGTEFLTRIERRILRRLIEGQSVKTIACAMDMSASTSGAHVRNLCRKTGVESAAQAGLFGVQQPHATRRGAIFRTGLHAVSVTCDCHHCQARRAAA